MGLTHAKVSAIADGTDDTLIRPSDWNADHVGTVPLVGACVNTSAAITYANNSNQVILYDTEDFDTDGFHSVLANTGRLTVPAGLGGKYIVGSSMYCTVALFWNIVYINGVGSWVNKQMVRYRNNGATGLLVLVAGDYVENNIYGDQGNSDVTSHFWLYRIG